jgi:hypothetical protein
MELRGIDRAIEIVHPLLDRNGRTKNVVGRLPSRVVGRTFLRSAWAALTFPSRQVRLRAVSQGVEPLLENDRSDRCEKKFGCRVETTCVLSSGARVVRPSAEAAKW